MHQIITSIQVLKTSGAFLFVKVAPWIVTLTSGGTEALVSTIIVGSYRVIQPAIRKSRVRWNERVAFQKLVKSIS
jgi:hypothetical protein